MKRFLSVLLVTFLMLSLGACAKTTNDGKKIEKAENAEMSVTLLSGEERAGKYTGEIVDGKMEGEGTFATQNSEGETWVYTGSFKDGYFKGQGTIIWGDGKRKEVGEYDHEELNGEGKVYIYDTLIEEGAYENGFLNGKGKMYDESGALVHEGDFETGRPAIASVGFNQSVAFADWEYFSTKAEEHTSVGEYATSEKYVVYLVSCKNNSKGARELGDFFILEDDKGRIYNMNGDVSLEYQHTFDTANWYLDEIGPSLTGNDIPIAFEVPGEARGFKLIPDSGYYKKVPAIEVEISK